LQKWIKEVARGQKGAKDLTYEQTVEVVETIVNQNATDAQIAAYLVGERIKMESPEELLAWIHVLQQNATTLTLAQEVQKNIIDFTGPYNGRNSFAATIPVSMLLAEAGIPAYIAAPNSLPPKYGTSLKAIMEHLGWKANKPSLTDTFVFVDPEEYCPPLHQLRTIREEIGIRTLLNTVEKLLNLANAKRIMLGAFHRTAIHKLNDVFKHLTYEDVFIVQGMEGSEDVPAHRNSFVYHITKDDLTTFTVKPKEYGLECKQFDKSIKLSASEQATIITSLFSGEQKKAYEYYYNQVLLNAGLRYYLFGFQPTIEQGVQYAKEQLHSGKIMEYVHNWRNQ
jgi:anthranilate phosphoribosyltransferase